MISAALALLLPSARLADDELRAADALDHAIDAHIREHMKRGGVMFDTTETRTSVVDEASWRLRKAGYQVQIGTAHSKPLFAGQEPRIVGYRLIISPTDEAYRAADITASG